MPGSLLHRTDHSKSGMGCDLKECLRELWLLQQDRLSVIRPDCFYCREEREVHGWSVPAVLLDDSAADTAKQRPITMAIITE